MPLPPPDGELTTKSVPLGEGWLIGPASCNSFTLLDILNLFAKFLHFCFDRQTRFLDGEVRRFGKRRICLAVELLEQEVEHFPCVARSIKRFLKLRKVTAQPNHLFTHVTAIRKVGDFLGQSHGIYLNDLTTAIQQFTNPFLQSQAISIRETCGRGLNDRNERFDLLHTFTQFLLECFTFLLAHLLKLVESLVQGAFECTGDSVVDAVASRLKAPGIRAITLMSSSPAISKSC